MQLAVFDGMLARLQQRASWGREHPTAALLIAAMAAGLAVTVVVQPVDVVTTRLWNQPSGYGQGGESGQSRGQRGHRDLCRGPAIMRVCSGFLGLSNPCTFPLYASLLQSSMVYPRCTAMPGSARRRLWFWRVRRRYTRAAQRTCCGWGPTPWLHCFCWTTSRGRCSCTRHSEGSGQTLLGIEKTHPASE